MSIPMLGYQRARNFPTMPCVFFYPVALLDRGDWIHAPRLPLGDPYRGTCHAVPNQPFEPAESEQRELCNCGYARDRCDRIPPGAPDAVRFSVSDEAHGRLQITWAIERDHSPIEFGTFEYVAAPEGGDGKLSLGNALGNALLTAQALAFVRSYLALNVSNATAP